MQMTEYDFLLRAWQNSQELVRDFENYSKKVESPELRDVFKKFAEEEGMHASKFSQLASNYKPDQR
jgi:rubrerythrin